MVKKGYGMNIEDILALQMGDLSYWECTTCLNYFFIHEIGNGLNDPSYCPYCGVGFEVEMEKGIV